METRGRRRGEEGGGGEERRHARHIKALDAKKKLFGKATTASSCYPPIASGVDKRQREAEDEDEEELAATGRGPGAPNTAEEKP